MIRRNRGSFFHSPVHVTGDLSGINRDHAVCFFRYVQIMSDHQYSLVIFLLGHSEKMNDLFTAVFIKAEEKLMEWLYF